MPKWQKKTLHHSPKMRLANVAPTTTDALFAPVTTIALLVKTTAQTLRHARTTVHHVKTIKLLETIVNNNHAPTILSVILKRAILQTQPT
jgi:hypothetical protein